MARRKPAAPAISAAMLAKLSVDLRIMIDREGRLPDAVLVLFPEPEKAGQAAVRVNEYEANERVDRVVEAVAAASKPTPPR